MGNIISIKHGGTEFATMNENKSVILNCSGKVINDNISASIDVEEYDGSLRYLGLCFTANTSGSTIAMSVNGTPTLSQNFQTSTDGSTWTTFTPGTTTITLTNVGDKVYFRGDNPNGVSESWNNYYNFAMTGSIAASGNIMSLIDNGVCTCVTIPNERCFYSMFYGCTSLTTPPALPATTLASSCYRNMFNGCTSLIVSDYSGTGYSKEWRIPTSGSFSNTYSQESMFEDCPKGGWRSSDDLDGATIYTYYIQNTPIS